MFAGSCIGVILLVMSLEALRRSVKEYDAYLINKHMATMQALSKDAAKSATVGFRPSVLQQAIRALLHMVQFAVAYFVMLYVYDTFQPVFCTTGWMANGV